MVWIIVGVAALAAWYFTQGPASPAVPTPLVSAGVPVGAPAQTSTNNVTTTMGAPLAVSMNPTGAPPASNPSNATTPQAQSSMTNFQAYVTKYQHTGWNGLLTPQQWNYYYAQGSKQTVSQQHAVGSSTQPINVNTYWGLRAGAGLSL
jgi:hypothetical protein